MGGNTARKALAMKVRSGGILASRFMLAAVSGLGLAVGARAVHASTGPENTLVVIDPTDLDSLEIGNHYVWARGVPHCNVLYLPLAAPDYATFATDQIVTLLAEIERRDLAPQIDVLVTSSQAVYRYPLSGAISETASVCPGGTEVGHVSLTAALSLAPLANKLLAGDADEFYGLNTTDPNPYYANTNAIRPFDAASRWWGGEVTTLPVGERSYIAAMLGYTGPGGNTVDEILAMIDRSAAADATEPAGTFYLMKTSDVVRSSVRDPFFAEVINTVSSLGGQAVQPVPDAVFPSGAADCLGILTAWPDPDIAGGSFSLLPGAYCDHLTSFAGDFDSPQQTKLSAWIAKGASASHGTIEEPCPAAGKFPHPRVIADYFQGLSIGESIYRSLGYLPFQSLVYGDPLTNPFATPPQVAVVDLPPNGASGILTLDVDASAQAVDASIARLELYVDGRLEGVAPPAAVLTLGTWQLADGPHELRVVAVDDTAAAHRGRWCGWLTTNNYGKTVQLECTTPAIDLNTVAELCFSATGGSIRQVTIVHNGRIIATSRASSGRVHVQGDVFGPGTVQVQADVEFTDRSHAVSAPVTIQVDRGGACCRTDGTCQAHSQTVCEQKLGGSYGGDGSSCSTQNCATCQTGDFDASGDVDLADFADLQSCLAGSNGIPVTPYRGSTSGESCLCAFDFSGDGVLDQADFASFVSQLRGPVAKSQPPRAYAYDIAIQGRGPRVIALPAADLNGDIVSMEIDELPAQAVIAGTGSQRVLQADPFATGGDQLVFRAMDSNGALGVATIGIRYELPWYIDVHVEGLGEPNALIHVDPPDVQGRSQVRLPADLRFGTIGDVLTLTAEDPNGVSPFVHWIVDGSVQPVGSDAVSVPLSTPRIAIATYQPRRILQVWSNRPNTVISNFTLDVNGEGSGSTPFERVYEASQADVLLNAPGSSGGKPFHCWRIDGIDQAVGSTLVFVHSMTDNHRAVALYSQIPGDFDADFDFDMKDLAAFQCCYSGPNSAPGFEPPSPECLAVFDVDGADGDIDSTDWEMLHSEHVTGPL